ncbi:MAG: aminotransferase class I/II-fold pyridoxal phosphate-dependent enzyme [Phycisphaerae bacterium]|nr:aminotransferase class I/II-fold pyridoxal phosphate-dependent enzyme [Phycisphaerae bacterium]
MDYLAPRSGIMDASGIRKIWQLAAKMKDPVDFSIGQPDFDAPAELKAAAIDAINQGNNGYSLTTGYEPLRQRIAADISDNIGWDKPEVMVTCGTSGALNLIFWATVAQDDEVLIPDPYFVMYKHLVNFNGGKCVYVDTYPSFQLKPEQLETLITPRTKILIVNSPTNPSGAVYNEDDLRKIAEIARKHQLLIISDEIYSRFSYDNEAVSIAKYYENTIIVSGMSKSYGITGWRIGYIAVPSHLKEMFERMAAMQQFTFVCAPTPLQMATLKGYDCDITPLIDQYRNKRDMVYNGLKDDFGLVKPGGAFYAFVPAPGGNATEFVKKAIANDVLVIPGSVFSARDTHFRLSFATSDEKIQKGLERLRKIAK